MITCIKCLKFTEPEIIVIERSDHYPLCEKCGVSVVDLVERMPLDYTLPEEEIEDSGEIVEVMEQPKAPA
jgi:hypothetical protein